MQSLIVLVLSFAAVCIVCSHLVFASQLSAWTTLSTSGPSPPRLFSPAYVHVGGNQGNITDPRDELWIFGGQKADGSLNSEMYKLVLTSKNESSWSIIATTGSGGIPCTGCCLAWDGGDNLYLRGGADPKNNKILNILSRFSMSTATWTALRHKEPYGVYGISGACVSFNLNDATQAKASWFSGINYYDFKSTPSSFDTGMLELPFETEMPVLYEWLGFGDFELGLFGHSLTMSGDYSDAYMFGGIGPESFTVPSTLLWHFTVKTDGAGDPAMVLEPDYNGPLSSDAPSLAFASVVQNDDYIFVYGGTPFVNWTLDGTTNQPTITCLKTLYSYDLKLNRWTDLTNQQINSPGSRCGAATILSSSGSLVMYGGISDLPGMDGPFVLGLDEFMTHKQAAV